MVVEVIVENDSKRADSYLSQVLPLSRNQIQKYIKEHILTLNGLPFKPSDSLRAGDKITGHLPSEETSQLQPVNIPLEILYEDSDIIVINKEKGVVVHPACGHHNDTLVNALLFHCKDFQPIGGILRPGVVHRLDKDTAGVLVFAKNEKALKELQRQFKERTVKKRYLALVLGTPPKMEDIIITAIGRKSNDRLKFAVKKEGKEAITHYRTLLSSEGISLIEVFIKTGRTHQIRVHMNFIGNPILGDKFYNKKNYSQYIKDKTLLQMAMAIEGQALFAEHLEFKHPTTGNLLSFHGLMPDDMKKIVSRLGKYATNKET